MFASLGKVSSARDSADYYIHSQASHRQPGEYYLAGEEPDGVWYNPHGMFGLKDGDKVLADAFYTLHSGFHPRNPPLDFRPRLSPKLTQNTGRNNRTAAYDLTFSAGKAVSAVWAMARRELRADIAKAHEDAVRSALDLIVKEHCFWTRHRPDSNADMQVMAAKLMAATFQHQSSRAGDPRLRTHAVIFNFTQADDGKFRALYARPLYAWARTAGAVYRSALVHKLREHPGTDIQDHGHGGNLFTPTDTSLDATQYTIDNVIDGILQRLSRIGRLWSYPRLIAEIVDSTAALLPPERSIDLVAPVLSDPRIAELDRRDHGPDGRAHLPHFRRFAYVI